MKKLFASIVGLTSLITLLTSTVEMRAADMQERIQTATEILADKQHSSHPIPVNYLNQAKGVAIFNLTKGGLGIGGQGGEGIVVLRIPNQVSHSWSAPSAFNCGGASIGAQIGFVQTRYIVVLNTDDAVRHFTSSEKITWNATATGSAGSDSATEKVSTTDLSRSEVIVYKDINGVFGGATLGGTGIETKHEINRQMYGENVHLKNILDGSVIAPDSAKQLFMLLDGKE